MILSTEGNKWAPENPTEMYFQLVDSRTDKPIKNLQLAHERLMHIFITDERLEYFAHVHVSVSFSSRAKKAEGKAAPAKKSRPV